MTPTPQLALTEHQQAVVTIALELETMGWIAPAHALRKKHFPNLPWEAVAKTHGATSHAGWIHLMRVHHGSVPPMPVGVVQHAL